jgi:U1 small nuclear ribonucleoprotein
LKKEFELFGPIETIRLVKDKAGKSRGYAFCTFKRERDADYAI